MESFKIFSTILTFIRFKSTLSVPSPLVTRGQEMVREAGTTSIIFGIFGLEDSLNFQILFNTTRGAANLSKRDLKRPQQLKKITD